jgi:hypothetical protein
MHRYGGKPPVEAVRSRAHGGPDTIFWPRDDGRQASKGLRLLTPTNGNHEVFVDYDNFLGLLSTPRSITTETIAQVITKVIAEMGFGRWPVRRGADTAVARVIVMYWGDIT